MNLAEVIRQMPKAELHVHLEGAILPTTLRTLAAKNGVQLPFETEAELRQWYTFTDFPHFVEVYDANCHCIFTTEDMEFVAREFVREQARQNIVYSEVIFTPMIHYHQKQRPFADQLAALKRGFEWGRTTFGVETAIVVDISRECTPEESLQVADWAISGMKDGVIALGLGGPEVGYPPQLHQPAFARAHAAGLPALPHAGETEGPASIWGALDTLNPSRILHGVRCMEDEALIERLRLQQIALDVCPTSNICLKVFPSLGEHPLPRMLEAGLNITINSDDPPMFNTTLTDEYLALIEVFSLSAAQVRGLALNAVHNSLLAPAAKNALAQRLEREYNRLFSQLGEPLQLATA